MTDHAIEYSPISDGMTQHVGQAVAAGFRASVPVLMSIHHPEGWRLEVLLQQLREEIREKNEKVGKIGGDVAAIVVANNAAILVMLAQCQRLQEQTLLVLDTIAPDPGPAGPPRL